MTTLTPLQQALTCAVLQPGLNAVLLLDAPLSAFNAAQQQFAQIIQHLHGLTEPPTTVYLDNTSHDDTLWGHWQPLQHADHALTLQWHMGVSSILPPDDTQPRLIVIPNLAALSNIAALRAIITVANADTLYLERHGVKQIRTPRLFWLAAIQIKDIGEVSPHVLDRFSVRLLDKSVPLSVEQRLAWLQQQVDLLLAGESPDLSISTLSTSAIAFLQQLRSHPYPKFTADLFNHLPEPDLAKAGLSLVDSPVRRLIALSRLATALARLDATEMVALPHLQQAIALMWLTPQSKFFADADGANDTDAEQPDQDTADMDRQKSNADAVKQRQTQQATDAVKLDNAADNTGESAHDSTTTHTAQAATLASPYPEDNIPPAREAFTLRLPHGQRQSARTASALRGQIIGVEPAKDLRDLAWVASLLEAAKYQRIRGRLAGQPLQFSLHDLRRYRRVPTAQYLLVLVLDYTCCKTIENWQNVLVSDLRWAYINRLPIYLIQVGAVLTGVSEKRAVKSMFRSLLVPALSSALQAEAGTATPLAHGLALAFQALQHELQHGRNRKQQARLVVLTDGRGNVPLVDSQTGSVTYPVGRQGVEDALAVANDIAALGRVETFLINPQSLHYPKLPLQLAQALGGKVVPLRK